MTPDLCVEALEEAIAKYGTPEIFNTDQGSRFASADFTRVLIDHSIEISMDGKGRWIDNVFVERLWRSVKCNQLADCFTFYDTQRPHSSLGARTPDTAYFDSIAAKLAA